MIPCPISIFPVKQATRPSSPILRKCVRIGGHPRAATSASSLLREQLGVAESHQNEDTAAHDLEEFPAVGGERLRRVAKVEFQDFVSHGLSPPRIARAADWMASTIRTWAPQRHKLWSMVLTISARLGLGLLRKSPTARRIIPGVQNPH